MIASATTEAVFVRMNSDATLRSLVNVFKPGGNLNIYTAAPIPESAEYPLILSAGNVSILPWDTKTTRGFDVSRDIVVYDNATHTMLLVEQVADRIHELFHRFPLQPSGFLPAIVSECQGPTGAPTSEDYVGMMVQCSWKFEKTP